MFKFMLVAHYVIVFTLHSYSVYVFISAALIVRFLTKRFIGDYEANTGKPHSRACTQTRTPARSLTHVSLERL